MSSPTWTNWAWPWGLRFCIAQWERCRDAAAGQDQVKEKGVAYLPQLGGQDTSRYEAYKQRGLYLEAFPRTVQGLGGAVFRKQPQLEHREDEATLAFLADVTGSGQPLERFAQGVLNENLTVGRVGVWLTMDAVPRAENTPRLVVVPGENIVNWDDAGRWVILKEEVQDLGEDAYERKNVEQWRELLLDESGQYVVRLWRKDEQNLSPQGQAQFVQVGDDILPMRRGERLDFIPLSSSW